MATGEIVRSILLTRNQLFRMEELAVSACADFIDHSWFQVHEDAARHVLPRTRFAEKRVESIISTAYGLV